jgi:hypothetical protein
MYNLINGLSAAMATITLTVAVFAIVKRNPMWMDSASTLAGVTSVIYTLRLVAIITSTGDRFGMVTSAGLVVMFTALVIACRRAAMKIRSQE